MSERQNKIRNETQHNGNEQLVEIAENQKELMRSKLEDAEKQHQEKQAESEILANATELAESASHSKEDVHQDSPIEKRRGAPSKKQLNSSFNEQMKHIQTDLGPGSRLFSKMIHIRAVEKISDSVSSTIARPNAMLCGSIAAFITITALYFIARHYGYKLSGFETIAAFCAGWLLGIAYDYFVTLFRNRKP